MVLLMGVMPARPEVWVPVLSVVSILYLALMLTRRDLSPVLSRAMPDGFEHKGKRYFVRWEEIEEAEILTYLG